MEILRSLGAQVQGKTNLDEFGMGSHSINSFFGPVHNNSIPRRSVGGSSGGSAIAVAEKVSQFALGTDTGGSVRLPAAYTGVVGFKPSYGLISRRGVVPYANSLDTVGILAPDAKYLHHVLHYVRQHDDQDPTSVTSTAWERINVQAESAGLTEDDYFANLTIGFPVEYNIEELNPAIRQAWLDTLSLLRDKGCKIVPVSLPSTKHALSAYYVLAPAEAASNLSKYDGVRYGTREVPSDGAGHVLYSETRGDGFGDEVKRRILLGSYTLSATAIDNYFLKAQKVRRLVQRDFDRIFKTENPLLPPQQFDISDMHESIPLQNKLGPSQVDFILCPTAPTLPPTLGDAFNQMGVDSYMNDVFTVPASLAGLPAISIPCKIPKEFQEKDLPQIAGIQIIGQYGEDFRLLELSKRLDYILNANPKIKPSTESRVRKEIFKTDPTRAAKVTKRLIHPWVNTEIEVNSAPGGPRIVKHFAERVVKKNIVMKHMSLPKKSEVRLASDEPRIREQLALHIEIKRKELLRKYISEKGEYQRKSLTDGEASNMLLVGFDEWLASSQGMRTHASATREHEGKSLPFGSPEDPTRVVDWKPKVGSQEPMGYDSFDDLDDIDKDSGDSVSWNDAVRFSEQAVPNAGRFSSRQMRNDNTVTQDFVKRNPFPSVDGDIPTEEPKAEQTPEPHPSETHGLAKAVASSKQKRKSKGNTGVSASLDKNTDPPVIRDTQQAKDNWTKLLESFENPPKTQSNADTTPGTGSARRAKGRARFSETSLSKTAKHQKSRALEQDENLGTFSGGGAVSARNNQDKFSKSQMGSAKSDGGFEDGANSGGTSRWWNPFN